MIAVNLARLARHSPLPHRAIGIGKAVFSVGRFYYQWLLGRYARMRHRSKHGQNLIFVAGLPKSGTSWVEGMLASFAGFQKIMPPEVVFHELRHGGSHEFELSERLLTRLQEGLFVLKLHAHGSPNNVRLLRRLGLRYAVIYRDLRDVAVSHYFYVRRTPWHPEHAIYRAFSVREGIDHFADTLLEPFAAWIEGWMMRADEDLAVCVRYEDMLEDALGELGTLVNHFRIVAGSSEIHEVQKAHSFKRASGGRERGESKEDSFRRKGVAGDWKAWFSQEQERRYRELAEGALEAGHYL